VVDFGIDATHRDWVRTDGTNVIRDCYAPFQQECGDTQYPNGHGTHVAGIIAAADNTVDVVGVAPGASIYDYNAVDGGLVTDGTLIVVLDQVLYASHRVLPNIRVVNMSVGRYKDASNPNDGAALLSSITNLYNAGIAVVVAAGNDPTVQVSDMIPAGFTTVLSVASTTATWGAKDASSQCVPYPQIVPDTASFFTTDGTSVTISAPGEKQENLGYYYGACGITAVGIDSLKRGGGVVALPGTSMAAPHVTGVIALVLQRADQLGLTLSVEDIRSQIKNSANRIGVAPLDSIQVSYTFDGVREGIISASGALQFP
jgi:subtilisin family serine protease